jgi:hypothetical protein
MFADHNQSPGQPRGLQSQRCPTLSVTGDTKHVLKIDAAAHLSERRSCHEIEEFVSLIWTCRHPQCL